MGGEEAPSMAQTTSAGFQQALQTLGLSDARASLKQAESLAYQSNFQEVSPIELATAMNEATQKFEQLVAIRDGLVKTVDRLMNMPV